MCNALKYNYSFHFIFYYQKKFSIHLLFLFKMKQNNNFISYYPFFILEKNSVIYRFFAINVYNILLLIPRSLK